MQRIRDSEIEQWVLRELEFERGLSAKELCVFCVDGIATLSGTVKTDHEKRAAVRGAARAAGVQRVIDNIKVNVAAQRMVIRLSFPASAPVEL